MLATYLKNSAFDLRLNNTVPLIYNPRTNILSHYYHLTPLNYMRDLRGKPKNTLEKSQ